MYLPEPMLETASYASLSVLILMTWSPLGTWRTLVPSAPKSRWGAMENVSLMLACSQLGLTVCSLLILNVSEPAIHHLLEVPLHAVGMGDAVAGPLAFVVTLILVNTLVVPADELNLLPTQ